MFGSLGMPALQSTLEEEIRLEERRPAEAAKQTAPPAPTTPAPPVSKVS